MSSTSSRVLSVVVMTYNEEKNISQCLRSVEGLSNDVLVFDSYSTDNTVELASSLGARVEQFTFDTYADQRRRMIRMAKHDWILTLDADEFLSPELKASILQSAGSENFDGYTSNRKSKIGARWMNHGSWYPDSKIRMFDRRKFSVEGYDVHETIVPVSNAKVGHLEGDLMHHADEDIQARYEKVNRYSTRAAEGLFHIKKRTNFLKIFFKPCVRFISVYLIRKGIFDGYYGYVVAKSEAHYVWLREVKLSELWRNKYMPD
ncbi:MAG: glycosyltransferase family 2 protein [Bacteroidota bacterium]|nr:glycosyltransferase family 2 protein [Bacteroidota bacterium]